MTTGLKTAPRNFPVQVPVPVRDLVIAATLNESVFISGEPRLHTAQTTASLKRLSCGLDVETSVRNVYRQINEAPRAGKRNTTLIPPPPASTHEAAW